MRARNVVCIKSIQRVVKQTKMWMAYTAGLQLITSTKKRHNSTAWMYDYLHTRNRNSLCFNVMAELQNPTPFGHVFKNTVCVDVTLFLYLCISPLIEQQDTNGRPCTTVSERMYATLTYLTTGNLYRTPRFAWIVSVPRISNLVAETCCAII